MSRDNPTWRDAGFYPGSPLPVRDPAELDRQPIQTERTVIERAYNSRQYFSLQIYGDLWEYRGDASADQVEIDLGQAFPVKHIWVKNTGLVDMLYFCLGVGAATGNNSQSIQVAPGETREFTLTGVSVFTLAGNFYRLTVGI